jgi:mitochondrial import receptor subunit TOM40
LVTQPLHLKCDILVSSLCFSSSTCTPLRHGVNYLQSVSNCLALGGEGFWLGGQRKSGVGFAARYADDKTVATGQVATTGLVSLTYTAKVSDKAMLASDFMWNWNARQAQASVGYDYILRQSRLRGRVGYRFSRHVILH